MKLYLLTFKQIDFSRNLIAPVTDD